MKIKVRHNKQKLLSRSSLAIIALACWVPLRLFLELYLYDNIQDIPTNIEVSPRPPKCTMKELLRIRYQLQPQVCINTMRMQPYHKCSITAATKCPKATWLDDYYVEIYKKYFTLPSTSSSSPPPFLGISVGCNKGFDATNTLRMGTCDNTIDKNMWGKAMTEDGILHSSVCKQDSTDPFEIPQQCQDDNFLHPEGEMHCIEPMPETFKKLEHSANMLDYTQKGLKVTHAAISKESGTASFPIDSTPGIENQGLATCREGDNVNCIEVPVYSLSDFVEREVKGTGPINILSVDVEGFDGDVLLGATPDVLKRVEYLEFEYNWMGSWEKQHLYDIVEMLDEQNMTCYWAGIDRLWRITGCWMSYYDIHHWSNVACVNRSIHGLASRMENIFQRTLREDKEWLGLKVKAANLPSMADKWKNHMAMSLDEDKLRSKYLY